MITPDEYKQALSIINEFDNAIKTIRQYKAENTTGIPPDELVSESYLSVRIKNIIRASNAAGYLNPEIVYLSDITRAFEKDHLLFFKLPNFGKKSWNELLKYGLVYGFR